MVHLNLLQESKRVHDDKMRELQAQMEPAPSTSKNPRLVAPKPRRARKNKTESQVRLCFVSVHGILSTNMIMYAYAHVGREL